MYITDDGKTRIYIRLEEGRTSPMLGCCPNGTVTVDWGDGTTSDTLTGTSTSTVKWTPTHNYAAPGDYVVTLAVDGSMGFYGNTTSNALSGILRYSSSADVRNMGYHVNVKKIEVGADTVWSSACFYGLTSLESITIPHGVDLIGASSLRACWSLECVIIPDTVSTIQTYILYTDYSLKIVSFPNGLSKITNNTLYDSRNAVNVVIPDTVTVIESGAFRNVRMSNITIPSDVTSIASNAFSGCGFLTKFKLLPTVPPELANTNAFTDIPADCIFEVPAGTLSAYQVATNWSEFADRMVETGSGSGPGEEPGVYQ